MRIGLFLRNLDEEYQINVYHGIRARARALGIHLICIQGETLRTAPAETVRPFGLAREIRLDGLLVLSSVIIDSSDSKLSAAIPSYLPSVPVVSLGLRVQGMASLTIQSVRSLSRIMDHLLLDHGYRRFLFVGGPKAHRDTQTRERVFRKSLEAFSRVDSATTGTFDYAGFSESSGTEVVRKYLAGPPFDAIVAANDNMAMGILKVIRMHPDPAWRQCAVTGFDDVPRAALVSPPLTTIRQPLDALGTQALDVLVKLIGHEAVPRSISVASIPVFRGSCGCRPLDSSAASLPEADAKGIELQFQDMRRNVLESERWLRDSNYFGRDMGAVTTKEALTDRLDGFLGTLGVRDFFLVTAGALVYERLAGERTILPPGGLPILVGELFDSRIPQDEVHRDLCVLDLKSDDEALGLAVYSMDDRPLPYLSAALPHVGHALRRVRTLAAQADRNRILEGMVLARTTELTQTNRRLEREVEARRAAEAEVLQVSEFERQRFGLDLHDDICQRLAGMAMSIRSFTRNPTSSPTSLLADLGHQVEQTLQLTRQYAHASYPIELEHRGLEAVLETLCETVGRQNQFSCCFASSLSRLDRTVRGLPALNLYRIVQEALQNATKHSHASRIEVSAEVSDTSLILSIADNGTGLLPEKQGERGLGFRSMAYRAAQLGAKIELNGRPGIGTVVRVVVPRTSL